MGYAFYLTFDAMTYLDSAGIRKFEGAARLQKEAYRAWFAGLLCNVVAGVYQLYNLQITARENSEGVDAEKAVERKKLEKCVPFQSSLECDKWVGSGLLTSVCSILGNEAPPSCN